jgi:squalene cyclase
MKTTIMAARREPHSSERFSTTSPASRSLRVFLCHSSADKAAVRRLYNKLRQHNIDPWLDEENLLPGQDWEREISRAVRECDVVLVCLSRGSIGKKGYVQKK